MIAGQVTWTFEKHGKFVLSPISDQSTLMERVYSKKSTHRNYQDSHWAQSINEASLNAMATTYQRYQAEIKP